MQRQARARRTRRLLPIATLGALLAVGCGGHDGPSAPSRIAQGTLVASPDVQGRRTATGWSLRLALHLREAGGVPVTVHAATVALVDAAGAVQIEQTVEKPVGGTNRIAAAQELTTPALTFASDDGRPYPSAVRIAVQFTDDNGHAATSHGMTAVGALPPLVTIFGVVRYAPNSVPVPGATVRVEGGAHDGRTVTTDGNGYYSLGQVSGQMRLVVSAVGMVWSLVDVDAGQDTRLDVMLHPPRR